MTFKRPAPVTHEDRVLREIAARVSNVEELEIVLSGLPLDQRIIVKDKLRPLLSFSFDAAIEAEEHVDIEPAA